MSERLSRSLIAPDRPARRRSKETIFTKRFRKEFSLFARESLLYLNVFGAEFNFSERRGSEPVKIAARFQYQDKIFIWRTLTYINTDSFASKRTKAQAIDAENDLLLSLPHYDNAFLNMAVRVPAGDADIDNPGIRNWLARHSKGIRVFDKPPTTGAYDPQYDGR